MQYSQGGKHLPNSQTKDLTKACSELIRAKDKESSEI